MAFDLEALIQHGLKRDRRDNDSLLHCSSHLTVPLRRVQLESVLQSSGTPSNEFRLLVGTLVHQWLDGLLDSSKVPVMHEVSLTPWLPKGWSGTCDALIWNPELKAYDLHDFKTINNTLYVSVEPKEDHVVQVSAYAAGVLSSGIPLGNCYIDYLGILDNRFVSHLVAPIDPGEIVDRMEYIRDRVAEYQYEHHMSRDVLNKYLEPPAPVEERWNWNTHRKGWGAYVGPPYSCRYCPIDSTLCPCKLEPDTYLGINKRGKFYPGKEENDYGTPLTDPPEYDLE